MNRKRGSPPYKYAILLHISHHTKFGRFRSNRFGVGRGLPLILGTLGRRRLEMTMTNFEVYLQFTHITGTEIRVLITGYKTGHN